MLLRRALVWSIIASVLVLGLGAWAVAAQVPLPWRGELAPWVWAEFARGRLGWPQCQRPTRPNAALRERLPTTARFWCQTPGAGPAAQVQLQIEHGRVVTYWRGWSAPAGDAGALRDSLARSLVARRGPPQRCGGAVQGRGLPAMERLYWPGREVGIWLTLYRPASAGSAQDATVGAGQVELVASEVAQGCWGADRPAII